MTHNLRPEVYEKVKELSKEFGHIGGKLRRGDCMCFEGLVCEAYRRETGEGSWAADDAFQVDGLRLTALAPDPVRDWAVENPGHAMFLGPYYATAVNDDASSWDEVFAAADAPEVKKVRLH